MPLKPLVCCRAAHRKLFVCTDSIWVSEELLGVAFHRFYAISTTVRRHGSSVPGPMECRRRLGKRRMAHLSEATPAPPLDWGSLWGQHGQVDGTKWQWEAPTLRPQKPTVGTTSLPSWLADWGPSVQEALPISPDGEGLTETLATWPGRVEEELNRFRILLQTAMPRQVQSICDGFNQFFKQSLTLGLVTSETLDSALRRVTRDLSDNSTNTTVAATRCISFYMAVWEGIKACKVLGPINFDGNVMNNLLSYLTLQAPDIAEVQNLARDILHSVSPCQFYHMVPSIISLVNNWSSGWLKRQPVTEFAPYLAAAEETVSGANNMIFNARQLVMTMEEGHSSPEILAVARDTLSRTKLSISSAMHTIHKAENISFPLRASVESLADALERIPRKLVCNIIHKCSDQFIKDHLHGLKSNKAQVRELRYYWMSMVAKVRPVDYELFLAIWQKMEPHGAAVISPFTAHESSDIVLSHWISRGHVVEAAAVRNSFEASVPACGRRNFGLLLHSVNKHRESCWTKTKALFSLLIDLNKPWAVHDVLTQMLHLGLKLPASLLVPIITQTSSHSTRLAFNIYKIYSAIRFDSTPLKLELCPDLVVAMINDPNFTPRAIWATVGIPLKRGIVRLPMRDATDRHKYKHLSRSRVTLIHKMAVTFAHSDCRSQRVVIRSITNCARYLRAHGVPISSELTRAVGYASITREVLRGHWVGTERTRWALKLISWAEGKDVARQVADIASEWRQNLRKKHRLRMKRRDLNPQKMRPID